MMKYILLLILVVHSLIHLLGFVKEFRLAEVNQLSSDTLIPLFGGAKKAMGIFWLLSTVLLLLATIFWWKGTGSWWMIGVVGLLVSQVLIIFYWKDAKFGTIANVIMLVMVVVSYAQWHFVKKAEQDMQSIFTNGTTHCVVSDEMIEDLPEIVQRWMRQSGVVGKEMTYSVLLKQSGYLRSSKEQGWMPVSAVQYFNTEKPAFVWRVNASMKKIIPISGRDMYVKGKGAMLIKPLALFTAVDAQGPKIDQGAMLRFLSELCWMPAATLQPYCAWEEVSDSSAKLSVTDEGKTVSAIFTFDEQARLKSVFAKRYKEATDEQLTDWYIPIMHWDTFEGVTVPVKGDVIWKLKDGDYNYYRWEITDIRYNVPNL